MSAQKMHNWLPRHRITVDEYYRMADVGLLAPDARVELIEGEIIDMPRMGSLHAGIIARLDRLLQRATGDRASVRSQLPLRLSQHSEPQPDFVVLKPRHDDYIKSHPAPLETYLVVEVSDTTLRYDRQIKLPLYARNEIPEVWIVDLERGRLHVYRAPAQGSYRDVSFTDEPERITLSALPEVTVRLTGLFLS